MGARVEPPLTYQNRAPRSYIIALNVSEALRNTLDLSVSKHSPEKVDQLIEKYSKRTSTIGTDSQTQNKTVHIVV